MTPLQTARTRQREFMNERAAETLASASIVHNVDRAGNPHLLISVPNLEKAGNADVGIEIEQESEDSLAISVLIYDIPDEPVVYEMNFNPQKREDQSFLRSVLETSLFRMHPCQRVDDEWEVGGVQVFKIPQSVLLKLKQYSLSWDDLENENYADEKEDCAEEKVDYAEEKADAHLKESQSRSCRTSDPRETVIRKLKEQVNALRAQIYERDTRIIELEEELHQIKSKGRTYKLSSDRKSWWRPFS